MTELEREHRFAALREERSKSVNALGERTYEDADDNMSREEREYYLLCNLRFDPRRRYRQNRAEFWMHPSNFPQECDCVACRDEDQVDPCYNGCKEQCVEGCPYVPEYGLETHDHRIAHAGTKDYDAELARWKERYRDSKGIPRELLFLF